MPTDKMAQALKGFRQRQESAWAPTTGDGRAATGHDGPPARARAASSAAIVAMFRLRHRKLTTGEATYVFVETTFISSISTHFI